MKGTAKREHWLDYAEEKCGKQIVADTKILLKVMVLYIPVPLFWALYDQQGSRWTFQATRMVGDIGFYEVLPDQMQLVNPVLILFFIPVYEMVFYPFLSLLGIRRPLQKLALGGIFAGIAFLISAAVEYKLEQTYPVLPQAGEAQLRMFNGFPCNYTGNYDGETKIELGPYGYFEEKHIGLRTNQVNLYPFTFAVTGKNDHGCPDTITGSYQLSSAKATSVYLASAKPSGHDIYVEDPNKSNTGDPKLRVLLTTTKYTEFEWVDEDGVPRFAGNSTNRNIFSVIRGNYKFVVGGKLVATIRFLSGSVQTIIVQETTSGEYVHQMHQLAPPNSMNMMWLLPQYIVLTLGEVMFSVTGLSFSYAESPESMKSVLQASWLLTMSAGNFLVTIIASINPFKSQVDEFLFFGILMLIDMLLFSVLAYRYKSSGLQVGGVEQEEKDNEEKNHTPTAPALADGGHDNAAYTKSEWTTTIDHDLLLYIFILVVFVKQDIFRNKHEYFVRQRLEMGMWMWREVNAE